MENHTEKTTVVDNKPYDVCIGRFPMFRSEDLVNKSVSRSNRYLQYQKSRIKRALEQGEVEKAVLI